MYHYYSSLSSLSTYDSNDLVKDVYYPFPNQSLIFRNRPPHDRDLFSAC
jgi:hypothetical protein